MASELSTKFANRKVVPENPSALTFEKEFRENLEEFLGQMIEFETDYQDTIAASGTGGASLGDSISAMQSTANANFDSIKEALTANSLINIPATQDWQSADGSDLYASSLRFSTLDNRFNYLDGIISSAYTDNDESATYHNIQDRFKKDELRINNTETALSNAKIDTLGVDRGSINSWIDSVEAVSSSANTEVINARGGSLTLQDRLDSLDTQYDVDNGGVATINDRFLLAEGRLDSIDLQYTADKGLDINGNAYLSINARLLDMSAATTTAQGEVDAAEGRLDTLENSYVTDSGLDSLGNPHISIDARFNELETEINASLLTFANKAGDNTQDFATNNLTVDGTFTLSSLSNLDVSGSKIVGVAQGTDPTDAVNKASLDNLQTWMDGRVSNLENGLQLPDPAGMNDKFLQVSNAGAVTWADPPDLDPNSVNTGNYEWLPQVPFQAVQFDGEVYSSRTLAAGFTYFVAGDLFVATNDQNGNPVQLTVDSGTGAIDAMGKPIKGATLIVQGHILGNAAGVVADMSSAHKGKIVVQNWADSRSDYLIAEVTGSNNIIRTSELNLLGTHQFSSRLVMEANTELIIDTACNLIFKESLLSPQSTITINNDVGTGLPLGSVTYYDPIKIIEGAPAALDTLAEIADMLDGSGATSVMNQLTSMGSDVTQAQTDATQALADAAQASTDAAQASTDAANAAAAISNVSIGNLVATTEVATGDLVYKFSA